MNRTPKFAIGDRVSRLSDVFNTKSRRFYGYVRTIGMNQGSFVYGVQWDGETEIGGGYFGHGLRPESWSLKEHKEP